jgi:hypothetical protein
MTNLLARYRDQISTALVREQERRLKRGWSPRQATTQKPPPQQRTTP